jgi:hypothetical protein
MSSDPDIPAVSIKAVCATSWLFRKSDVSACLARSKAQVGDAALGKIPVKAMLDVLTVTLPLAMDIGANADTERAMLPILFR